MCIIEVDNVGYINWQCRS